MLLWESVHILKEVNTGGGERTRALRAEAMAVSSAWKLLVTIPAGVVINFAGLSSMTAPAPPLKVPLEADPSVQMVTSDLGKDASSRSAFSLRTLGGS